MDDRRDDTGLYAVICPECGATVNVPLIRVLKQQQVVYLRCSFCGHGITKDQINETFREYVR